MSLKAEERRLSAQMKMYSIPSMMISLHAFLATWYTFSPRDNSATGRARHDSLVRQGGMEEVKKNMEENLS